MNTTQKHLTRILLPLAALLLATASCSTQKKAVADNQNSSSVTEMSEDMRMLLFVQKVFNNQLNTKNIVGNLSLTINTDGKAITVPGSLHMRKDEVIRIQAFIPILGSEVGRIEFTPDRVLLIDRMHKEYVEGSYDQLSFLKANGLSFYSLQAMFWNQLLLPGKERVTDIDLRDYHVDLAATGKMPVSLKEQQGSISYLWDAEPANGRIDAAHVSYTNDRYSSRLDWSYSNFSTVGIKPFPTFQDLFFTLSAGGQSKSLRLTLDMSEVTTDDKWEPRTQVSAKFKKVEPEELLKKLTQLQ